ncbi:IS66 family transposase [Streptomyces noursei]|uniref:IS66 family transposase n=1 Tax=Streptomyces noursei TaxID=1971 RepID=UPI000C9C990E|nr:transposase [Streptomyces noursei]
MTGAFVHLSVHRRRGTDGTDAAGILPAFRGVAMHDAWAPYDTYTEATHTLCSAHALRELIAVTERGHEAARCAAYRATDALLALKQAADTARETDAGHIDNAVRARELAGLHTAVTDGLTTTAARSSKTERKHNVLFKRLGTRWGDYLRFSPRPTAALRQQRRRANDSGWRNCGSRSPAACGPWPGPRTSPQSAPNLATAGRHDQPLLDVLVQAMRGSPWTPATT